MSLPDSPLLTEEIIKAASENTGISRDGIIGVLVAAHNILAQQSISMPESEEPPLPDNVVDLTAYRDKKNGKNVFA